MKMFCRRIINRFCCEKQGSDLSKANDYQKAGGALQMLHAIAKLVVKVFFIGCVGKDPFGTFLINTLAGDKWTIP